MSGCGDDDIVEIPEELRGEPWCMLIVGTWGHYDDGSSEMILNEATGSAAAGCLCASRDDILAGTRHDELNGVALDICQDIAATKNFAWDECQEDHDSGYWLVAYVHAEGDDAHFKPAGLQCYGE
ncbi:hypothetical protein [Enhygromyxa salina]|uniref:hypothetical protein n=1 Tax=Enhygromyxa salina TaxID=215803 RepID=UPI000D093C0F|nr:hypothetical protein [Enhygromyxa salina]